MATLSPSKPHAKPGCVPTPVHHTKSSPQRAALVPRSALPEPGRQTAAASPNSTSLSAMQAIQAFNSDDARDGAFLFSAEGLRQELRYDAASMTSVSALSGCDSDEETRRGSSEASVDIITERDPVAYNDVRSASPRKPLPPQWLPPHKVPTLTTSQRTEIRGDTAKSPSSSPIDRRAVQATRSSITLGRARADPTSFLTKEALDAVDADIASPTLRKSPSKIQHSSTKAPWNSPPASQKLGSVRHGGMSSTKLSPSRAARLGVHVTAHQRHAPSSIVSTGGTSFHTARGSPVRSSACSWSSLSSTEDLNDTIYFHCSDYWNDVDIEQFDEPSSKRTSAAMTATKASLQSRSSRPELSIRIPPSNSAFDAERSSASTLASASSSKSVRGAKSPGHDQLKGHNGTAPQSRIPRVSISTGSSAHAPTLSSTLKQTKSTQTLRSPKATKAKTELKSPATSKAAGSRSLRHVRTVDSTGSTPILSDRKRRDFSIPVASVSTTNTDRTTSAREVGLMTSHLQDIALRTPALAGDLPSSSTTSRETSISTVKALQTTSNPSSSTSTSLLACEIRDLPGNVHSSDADDENDDSSIPVIARGRSAHYSPSIRRATNSEVSMQSSSVSDLRPTATEFVPALKDTLENVAPGEHLLPDMYALDGYGIPWFYHMYPVPWMYPSMYMKPRSRSPRKFKPQKQRPTPGFTAADQQIRSEAYNSTQTGITVSVENWASTVRKHTGAFNAVAQHDHSTRAAENLSATRPNSNVKASDGPFSAQLDIIAQQAALQTKVKAKTMQLPDIDLTTIRNVPVQSESPKGHAYNYNTGPYKRRNQRQVGNGLYGGHGNVGVPLHATAPFPMPVPPMGRPAEPSGDGHNVYVGYALGAQACGTIDIERAAERGGGQACNTCEPDH